MVSVARKNMFQEKTRLLISVTGVAFALLLVLALEGLVAGAMEQITAYINNTGAEVYVAQPGVRTMHMSGSALPLSKLGEVRRADGVARAEPILYTSSAITRGDERSLAYIIGFDPASAVGGPWKLSSGSAVLERGDAVVDATAAKNLGVGLGDQVTVLGGQFRVRGLSNETASFVNSIAFVRIDDFAALRGQSATASYILVWPAPGSSPQDVVQRVNAAVTGVSALTRAEFSEEEKSVVRDMSAEIMLIMNSIGFLIGLAAVGLTIYTATLAKMQEYGVLKALGAGNGWLYRLVIQQAFVSVAIGAAISVLLAFALSLVLPLVVPGVMLRVELGAVVKVFAGAAAIAAIAAVVPIRQVASLDPVAVFRR